MGIKKDWLEQQIEAIGNTFAAILFGKDKVNAILDMDDEEDSSTKENNTTTNCDMEILKAMIKMRIKSNDYNGAERDIFNFIEGGQKTKELFILALDFFNKMHELSDETLAKYDYSHDKIEKGIERLKVLYNVD